jgi:regulatory protein
MRSVREVERKLAEKEIDEDLIEETIAFLREYALVDDAQFVRAYVSDQLLKRPVGKRRLSMALREKGVDAELTTSVLEDVINEEREFELAMAAAEKKLSTKVLDDAHKWERSLANFLAGRGFDWNVVSKVVRHYRERKRG